MAAIDYRALAAKAREEADASTLEMCANAAFARKLLGSFWRAGMTQ